jgi:hypothetical protein
MFNKRSMLFGVLAVLSLLAAGTLYWLVPGLKAVEVYAPTARASAATPLCPWRTPEEDMRAFFPGATRYNTHVEILSDRLVQLKERLGHWPRPEENPFYIHKVYAANRPLGRVALRRVKGEFGAIEIVLAVDNSGTVRGARLQRLREPAGTAQTLQSSQWLRSFYGKDQRSAWKLGVDVPDVPLHARKSATAVVEGVRSLLILLDEASQATPAQQMAGRPTAAQQAAAQQRKHH